jgi:hypothetical protein
MVKLISGTLGLQNTVYGFLIFLGLSLILMLLLKILSNSEKKLILQREELTSSISKLKKEYKRYDNFKDLEDECFQVFKLKELNESRLKEAEIQLVKTQRQLLEMREEFLSLEESLDIQSFGFYQPKYEFDDSSVYKNNIDQARKLQKELISKKTAVICHTEWTVEGSIQKGKKMINNLTKLYLRAFNGECDASILKAKYNNMEAIEKRVRSSFTAINKIAEVNSCNITQKYLTLKLEELYLTHEYHIKKQEEKEEQQQIREQIREGNQGRVIRGHET